MELIGTVDVVCFEWLGWFSGLTAEFAFVFREDFCKWLLGGEMRLRDGCRSVIARALRDREGVSQKVFAAYLNVTPSLVSKWERGEKHPQGAALKLLSLVEKKGLEIVA